MKKTRTFWGGCRVFLSLKYLYNSPPDGTEHEYVLLITNLYFIAMYTSQDPKCSQPGFKTTLKPPGTRPTICPKHCASKELELSIPLKVHMGRSGEQIYIFFHFQLWNSHYSGLFNSTPWLHAPI